ncbi:MAG: hypothetical protein U5L04_01610 [Trueperaceae bacterium]|nr:hypothetical protein [Trueperaceae bacterium]
MVDAWIIIVLALGVAAICYVLWRRGVLELDESVGIVGAVLAILVGVNALLGDLGLFSSGDQGDQDNDTGDDVVDNPHERKERDYVDELESDRKSDLSEQRDGDLSERVQRFRDRARQDGVLDDE